MPRKYKNAKTSYKKLSDDDKIDFLFSKIDSVTSHADELLLNIDKKVSSNKPDIEKTNVEKLQKGFIKISFSHKRLWEERMSIDKLFNGTNPILNGELLSLYSQEIIIKQTNQAPDVFRDNKGNIYVDFPKGIIHSHKIIQRNLVESFMRSYWYEISEKLKVNWSMDTMKNISIDFIKKSKLLLIKPETTDKELISVLREVLGLNTIGWYSRSQNSWWDGIAIRILQIGAMARKEKNPNAIEKGSMIVLDSLEKRLLSKLINRI